MFWQLKQKFHREKFNYMCSGVIKTPRIESDNSDLLIVSLVSHMDVMMYLVAIKTLYRHLGRGKIAIIDDGSLTKSDLVLLKSHVEFSEIVPISSIAMGQMPRGNCWERLAYVVDKSSDHYVIQVDSDNLFTGPLPEVEKCYKQNTSFITGSGFKVNGELLHGILPMPVVCEKMKIFKRDFVEVLIERHFDQLPRYQDLKYAKANVCFSGFGKNAVTRNKMEEFSDNMQRIVGDRWWEWGTEKITGVFLASNASKACVLPHPKYTSYYDQPEINYDQSAAIHFTGTHRFHKGYYIRKARETLQTIK